MSDGPHRSLPLKLPWKRYAERAARGASSSAEIEEALVHAAIDEFRQIPRVVRVAVCRNGLLLRPRGVSNGELPTTAGNILMEHWHKEAKVGAPNAAMRRRVVSGALREILRAAERSIREHYLRKARPSTAMRLIERSRAAVSQLDYSAVASGIVESSGSAPQSRLLRKRRGVDEGPEL